MSRLLATALCAPLLLLALAPGCGGEAPKAAEPRAPAEPREKAALRVETIEIAPRAFQDELEVTAVLEPWDEVAVASELGGYVRVVDFEKGDRVDSGKVLARIGDDLAEAQLEQAKADLMAAEANHTKVSRLFERQAVPQQDLVAATSRRDRARAVVREMEIRLERSVVRAPIDGVALDRLVDPGEVVAAGQTVTRLQRMGRLKAVATVPDTEVAWLERGRRATLHVDAYPDRSFPARVFFIAPAAESATRSFTMELALDNREGLLRPGMVGRAALSRRTIADAIVVPLDALVTTSTGARAFVVEACRAEEREVTVAGREGARALVAEGLDAGDHLVIAGQRDLVTGQRVISEVCP
jgi:membrane fusion protein (multidrug efflux system)